MVAEPTVNKAEVNIEQEQADSQDAVRLIQELEDVLDPLYPNESRHGYSVEKILREGVHFFVLRVGGDAAACGGVQFFDADDVEPAYGELKRMYVRQEYRGRGYAKDILDYLSTYARSHNVQRLRLETGIHQHEAIGLYEGWGFRRIGFFGSYSDDPLSIFYEITI